MAPLADDSDNDWEADDFEPEVDAPKAAANGEEPSLYWFAGRCAGEAEGVRSEEEDHDAMS